MRLVSVNVGREQALSHAKASGKTGIFKRPVGTPVRHVRRRLIRHAASYGRSVLPPSASGSRPN